MPIGDIYEIKLWQFTNGEHYVNRFHYFETVHSVDDSPCETLALRFKEVVVASFKAALSADWEATWLYTRRVQGEKIATDTEILQEVGSLSGQATSLNSPVIFSLNTGSNPSFAQGRIYVSGIREADTHAGVVVGTWLVIAEPLRENLRALLTATGPRTGQCRPCIWSPALETPRPVRVVEIRPNLATMRTRRRRPAVGS
jgi:hypothetical protein